MDIHNILFDLLFKKKRNINREIKQNQFGFKIDGLTLKKYIGRAETVVVPDDIMIVDESAFAGNKHIRNIIFQNNLYSIKDKAFQNCVNLKNVSFPNTVEDIAENAFWECSSLESLKIPEGVCVLGTYAFKGCSSLKKLTLPNTMSALLCFDKLDKSVIICANKGSMAEKAAKQAGYTFMPLDGTVEKGFFPWYTYGQPVVFYNPDKGVCKQIIAYDGTIEDFPGYEHPELVLQHYWSRENTLPQRSSGRRIEFSKNGNGYSMHMDIQSDSWYELGENGYEDLIIYAYMDDEGNFTSKLKLWKVGTHFYENTDFEEREYKELEKNKSR